jgi:hypothetical protein
MASLRPAISRDGDWNIYNGSLTMDAITPRQRLAIGRKIMVPENVLSMDPAELNMQFFKENGIPGTNLRLAGLMPRELKTLGATDATELRTLGYDALDLSESAFCSSCIAAFGSENVTSAFLLCPGDAVAIAGSTAVIQLGITVSRLLEACSGAPVQAKAVLQQVEPRGGALTGVPAWVLLDSGIRAKALCSVGYHSNAILSQTGCTQTEITQLGFV